MPNEITVGRIDLGPTEPRHLTQTEQRMMDGALRKSVRVIPDLLRVDVAGVPVFVRGEDARRHLEQINQRLARMKLALHKLRWVEGEVGEVAKIGLANDNP